jgi:hypothetical protein
MRPIRIMRHEPHAELNAMNLMVSDAPIPDFISPADINRLMNLIAVMADPKASQTMLEQLGAARDQAQVKIDEAAIEAARIETAERQHNERLKRERDEHASALAVAQTAFEEKCANREKVLHYQEEDVLAAKREAEKLMKEAQAAKADIERRLETIRGAAL